MYPASTHCGCVCSTQHNFAMTNKDTWDMKTGDELSGRNLGRNPNTKLANLHQLSFSALIWQPSPCYLSAYYSRARKSKMPFSFIVTTKELWARSRIHGYLSIDFHMLPYECQLYRAYSFNGSWIPIFPQDQSVQNWGNVSWTYAREEQSLPKLNQFNFLIWFTNMDMRRDMLT